MNISWISNETDLKVFLLWVLEQTKMVMIQHFKVEFDEIQHSILQM